MENLHGTLAHALFERIVDLLWAVAWHAANTVANQMDSNEEEEEEGNEDEDGEEGDEDDEDEADEQEPFGPDYPGSSDDAVEDMRQILTAFHGIFHSGDPYRGVRCALVSETEGNPSVLESISRVPGAFGVACLKRKHVKQFSCCLSTRIAENPISDLDVILKDDTCPELEHQVVVLSKGLNCIKQNCKLLCGHWVT